MYPFLYSLFFLYLLLGSTEFRYGRETFFLKYALLYRELLEYTRTFCIKVIVGKSSMYYFFACKTLINLSDFKMNIVFLYVNKTFFNKSYLIKQKEYTVLFFLLICFFGRIHRKINFLFFRFSKYSGSFCFLPVN